MDKAFEIWKDINGFEGIYQISDKGNIRSLDRKIICSNGSIRFQRGSGIKPYINKQGYRTAVLHNNGKHKMCRIFRLVAEAFIPNPNNLPQVNHKDENKGNDRVDNLEWCDAAYNNCYGTRLERVVKSKINGKNSYPVIQKIDNKVIETFPSLREVQRRTGYNKSLISKCCKGIYKQAYGYNWEFVSK